MRSLQPLDPLEVFGAGTADHAVDLVAVGQEELGQVGPVLPGDAGDQCSACHNETVRNG